jgi:hypothetical protein
MWMAGARKMPDAVCLEIAVNSRMHLEAGQCQGCHAVDLLCCVQDSSCTLLQDRPMFGMSIVLPAVAAHHACTTPFVVNVAPLHV